LRRKNQEVYAKKEACQKDSRIRGTKERSREKIPRSGGCCRKDFRIRRTKEWSREMIPGSGGQCEKKNETKKRFQTVRIRRHMNRRKDGRLVPCDFLLGRWLLGCSGYPLGGGAGVWWAGCSVGNQEGTSPSMQKRGARKGLQDQVVKRIEQRKDSKIRQSKKESRKKILGSGGRRRARKISQDALCTSSKMWAHSLQFEIKTSS
jgi:hypothetical protein